jgi:hypothetical protein
MDSLAYVVSKMFRHVFAATNISIIRIGQIAAQQRQSETVPIELVAGLSQLGIIPFNTQRSEELRTGIAG